MKNRSMVPHILLLVFLIAASAAANDRLGQVCFGDNLAKPFSEHTDRLYLTIDDSEKRYFNRTHAGPVADHLDLQRDHLIQVYFDDRIVASWILNFTKLNTQSVVIWRSSGAWHMDSAEAPRCP